MPAASDAAAMEASPFCVEVQTSSVPSGLNHAVAVIGSMVAWLRYGDEYSDSTIFAATGIIAGASPILRAVGRSFAARPSLKSAMMLSEETAPLVPSSHVIFSAFAAWFARHQLSATTATKVSCFTMPFTPRIFSASALSTDFTLPRNTGLCTMEAMSMPGSITSTP